MKNRSWKEKDKEYNILLQKFLDTCDNIDNINLKDRVIKNMILCDERLTILAEKEMEKLNKNK